MRIPSFLVGTALIAATVFLAGTSASAQAVDSQGVLFTDLWLDLPPYCHSMFDVEGGSLGYDCDVYLNAPYTLSVYGVLYLYQGNATGLGIKTFSIYSCPVDPFTGEQGGPLTMTYSSGQAPRYLTEG
jgi:hypothetical protein